MSVLANHHLETEVGGNGDFDHGGEGGKRLGERIVAGLVVEADAVAEWLKVGKENCGEIHSDTP
jgi:hypothetical protein